MNQGCACRRSRPGISPPSSRNPGVARGLLRVGSERGPVPSWNVEGRSGSLRRAEAGLNGPIRIRAVGREIGANPRSAGSAANSDRCVADGLGSSGFRRRPGKQRRPAPKRRKSAGLPHYSTTTRVSLPAAWGPVSLVSCADSANVLQMADCPKDRRQSSRIPSESRTRPPGSLVWASLGVAGVPIRTNRAAQREWGNFDRPDLYPSPVLDSSSNGPVR